METEEGAAGLRALDAIDPAEDVVEHITTGGVQGDDMLAQGAVERRDLVADSSEVPGDLFGQGEDLGEALGGLRPVERDEVASLDPRDLGVESVALGAQSLQTPHGGGIRVPGQATDLRGDGVQTRLRGDGTRAPAAHQEADGGLGRSGQLVGLPSGSRRRGAHEDTGSAPLVAVGPTRARCRYARIAQRREVFVDQLVKLGDGTATHLSSQVLGENRCGHRTQIGPEKSQPRILAHQSREPERICNDSAGSHRSPPRLVLILNTAGSGRVPVAESLTGTRVATTTDTRGGSCTTSCRLTEHCRVRLRRTGRDCPGSPRHALRPRCARHSWARPGSSRAE